LAVVVSFMVPGQPIGKGRPRIGKVGQHARMFTPAKTVGYEGLIAHAAHAAMAGRPLFEAPVTVNMRIECQVPQSWSAKKQRLALSGELRPGTKPDADNVIKAVFDGLNAVLWRDDALVCELHMRKLYSATPCVHVEVWTVHGVEQRAIAA
jgi:Holliday junction resolvase RusA-like endonuclease